MNKQSAFIKKLSKTDVHDLEMLNKYDREYIKIANSGLDLPDGFLLKPNAYLQFLKENSLVKKINDLLSTVHIERADSLMQVSGHIKKLIYDSKIHDELVHEIDAEYKKLCGIFKKAEVLVGENHQKIQGMENLLSEIKKIWASQFEPKHILDNHQTGKALISKGKSIIIQKKINYKKTGKLFTSDFSIYSDCKLSSAETKKIKSIGKKLKKHFYIPQIITWGILNKKIYTIDARPMTNAQKTYLVLVRHGESEWNAKGLWTGWTDIPLSKKGREQAKEDGEKLKDIHIDIAYTSALKRAKQTWEEIEKILTPNSPNLPNPPSIPTISTPALNERNYGDLTGKNKWEIQKEFGDEQFQDWRRGWDEPIRNGETLKDVYNRVVPYYTENILPRLKSGKNVIITAHGNSLRALAKYLENISDEDISKLEIPVGQILIYHVDENGSVVGKEIRNQHENVI